MKTCVSATLVGVLSGKASLSMMVETLGATSCSLASTRQRLLVRDTLEQEDMKRGGDVNVTADIINFFV